MTTIQLDYPPSTNRAWRMANGRMIQNQAVKTWKQSAQWIARAAGTPKLAGAVRIVATLHPRMTKSGQASKRRLDLDNSLKMALDALNGIAYCDDRQVVELISRVGYPLPEGGLTLQVEPALDCAVTLAGASANGK